MAKTNFYQNSDRLTNGQVLRDTDWNMRIFDEPQAEFELRWSLARGFFETPAVTAAGAQVSLVWPSASTGPAKGALLSGLRLTMAGGWTFTGSNIAGTYYLQLDTANNFVQNATENTAMLTVATVVWDGSSTLSTLALTTLAQNTGYQFIGQSSTGGGGSGNMSTSVYDPGATGSVLLARGINDEDGHAATAPQLLTAVQDMHAHANMTMLNALVSTLTGVLKMVSGMLTGGATAADVGAIPSTDLSTDGTLGESGTPSDSLVPSQKAVNTFVENALSGISGGLLYRGTWNASSNTTSSGGSLASGTGTAGAFYKVNVAGSTTIDGNSTWTVGDIILFDGSTWDRIAGTDGVVSSVFGRIGAVAATAGDYAASQITDDTGLNGTGTLKALLIWLNGKITALVTGVSSVFGRTGAVTAQSGDYTAAQVGAEPALGNPATSGYVLSSSTAGVRSWVAQSGGSGVSSFNTRTGAVTPAAGDYTASEITDNSGVSNPAATVAATLTALNNRRDEVSLLDLFREGFHSEELFTISPNGVNEFDLLYVGGYYHLFYDCKTGTNHRQATSIAGLATATDTALISDSSGHTGRYPTVYYDGTTWHLYVWNQVTLVTERWTCSTAAGIYVKQSDVMPTNYSDISVRMYNGVFYAGYKNIGVTPNVVGVITAAAPTGPWTDMGSTFGTIGVAAWHASQEADPLVFMYYGRLYMAFSGYDGSKQRVALAELNLSSLTAQSPAICIVEPLEVWQQLNESEVYSPVFLDDGNNQPRLYYSQNPGTTGDAAGWGYVEMAMSVEQPRRPWDGFRMDWRRTFNVATGMKVNWYGSPTPYNGGMKFAANGIYGALGVTNVMDFTLSVEFEMTTAPGSGNYSLLARVATTNPVINPIIAIWINGSNVLYINLHGNGTDTFSLTGTTTLTIGTRYTAILRRLGSAVNLYINSNPEVSGTNGNAITGLQEFCIANDKGSSAAAGQQFVGNIYNCYFTAEAVPLTKI